MKSLTAISMVHGENRAELPNTGTAESVMTTLRDLSDWAALALSAVIGWILFWREEGNLFFSFLTTFFRPGQNIARDEYDII